jgi:hypothetical protein
LTPETSPQVIGEKYGKMGGGEGGAKATLNRDGLLIIEGRSKSTSLIWGTRTSLFVVGTDRLGHTLFVSKQHDIPTVGSTLDPFCPSQITKTFTENIDPKIAKYVSKLDVYLGSRQDRGLSVTLNKLKGQIKPLDILLGQN